MFAIITLAAHAADVADFKIPLPKPFYGATPTGYMSPALEFTKPVDPDPIKAPAGTENVALNKPVTSSSAVGFGELAFVTDGAKSHEEKFVVEVGPGKNWIQIDLEKPCTVFGLGLWHYYGIERVYLDQIIQISDDPEFKTGVTTVFNNDHDNSSEMGKGADKEYIETYRGRVVRVPEGATGRYVRLHCRGNAESDLTHYIEVEVYGVPAK
jgi:hypothetical protein